MSSFLYKKIWHGISIHTRKCIPNLTSEKTKAETKVNEIQSELDKVNKGNDDRAKAIEAATKK